ncbi:hypothetical protein P7K49_002154 [Saguinus oedipus]|uniref:Uncharacterized protein n=1 Tax=Saguinus oedipus TaxID=9490 RepID=A0ABQ9WGM1_SAGOE|nr:hypothetical protein P7K49_002154 [Saguinus oedipus]
MWRADNDCPDPERTFVPFCREGVERPLPGESGWEGCGRSGPARAPPPTLAVVVALAKAQRGGGGGGGYMTTVVATARGTPPTGGVRKSDSGKNRELLSFGPRRQPLHRRQQPAHRTATRLRIRCVSIKSLRLRPSPLRASVQENSSLRSRPAAHAQIRSERSGNDGAVLGSFWGVVAAGDPAWFAPRCWSWAPLASCSRAAPALPAHSRGDADTREPGRQPRVPPCWQGAPGARRLGSGTRGAGMELGRWSRGHRQGAHGLTRAWPRGGRGKDRTLSRSRTPQGGAKLGGTRAGVAATLSQAGRSASHQRRGSSDAPGQGPSEEAKRRARPTVPAP